MRGVRGPIGTVRYRNPALLAAAVAIIAPLLAACGELTQSTQQPVADNARQIQDLFMPILWISAIIFVLVQGALIYSVIRYRRRSESDPIPVQVHGDTRLEALWTVAPAVIVVVVAVMTFRTMAVQAEAPPPDALKVVVEGHQWWWKVVYPDLGIETANEIYVPIDRAIDVSVESDDVIHSFWFPQIAGKIDAIPGRTNRTLFTVEKIGRYQGQCAEFCGFAHAQMKMLLFAVTEADFESWTAAMKSTPAPQGLAQQGAEIFNTFISPTTGRGCFICHTMDGTSAQGTLGPSLTALGSRSTLGAALIDNTTENLTAWIRNPADIKPGVLMPVVGLDDDQIAAVVAYLQSLR